MKDEQNKTLEALQINELKKFLPKDLPNGEPILHSMLRRTAFIEI